MVATPQHQGIQFERPIGAPADIAELEYISSLHQTNTEEIRTDASIYAKDIRNYLTSRHGLYCEPHIIEERILQQLAGHYVPEDGKQADENGDVEPTVMDLAQLVTVLLIPFLRREDIIEAGKPTNSLNHGIAEQVLKLILEELECKGIDMQQFKAIDNNFETGTRITKKLLQTMFECYGEYDVPTEVLQEMVHQAAQAEDTMGATSRNHHNNDDNSDDDDEDSVRLKTRRKTKGEDGPLIMLTKDSFLRALTADVQLYDPDQVDQSLTTTHFQDAQNATNPDSDTTDAMMDKAPFEDDFVTLNQFDQAADQYRSILWFCLLWVTLVLYYVCYVWDWNGLISFNSCQRQFGCDVGAACLNWLIVFAQVGVCGTLYITLGSGGNATNRGEEMGSTKVVTALRVVIAMGVVAAATIVPNFIQGDVFIWNTIKADGWEPLHWFTFALGVVLISLQFLRLADIFCGLGTLGIGGKGRAELAMKQAATKKLNIMVENAMLLHVAPVLAGEKLKSSEGWKFPARHTSPDVIRSASNWHKNHLEELKNDRRRKKKHRYREGSNIESLTRGEGTIRAIKHYKDTKENATETVGGVVWAYERIIDGRIFDEEGIWLSSRLITSNVAQGFVVGGLVIFYFVLLAWFDETKATSVAVGQQRRLEAANPTIQELQRLQEARRFMEERQRQHHRTALARQRHLMRRLQIVSQYNATHYTDGTGVYPNVIFDVNSTHFSDGTNFWPYATFSHNGTHVFDKFYRWNETHFTDGVRFYPYMQYATNGTHITNGEYLFDGTTISPLESNSLVATVQDWEFQVAASAGLAAAVAATVGIAIAYIPSFVSTVLKFRCGILASLRGGEPFQNIRTAPHQVTTLLGSAMWGAAYSGIIAGIFSFGFSFISVWSETRPAALALHALLIGFHAIVVIDFLVHRLFRDLYPSLFYRRHPAVVNLINVITESWNLAVGVGLMWYRSLKLLGVTIYYIGRIDTPVFAPGVGYVGPFPLDSEHFDFKRDLLIHEAHRHPYLERLGLMYLLKLHHGNEFGSRAGAYWRLLFVLALMPWMADWRIRSYEEKDDSDSDEEDESEDEEQGEKFKDDDSLMSLHGMELELDVTKRANEMLTKRNTDLKEVVEDLRNRLREANRSVKKLEKKVDRARSSRPGPASIESSSKPKKPSREPEEFISEDGTGVQGGDSFESESNSGNFPGPESVKQSDDNDSFESEEFDDEFSSSEEDLEELIKKEKAKRKKK